MTHDSYASRNAVVLKVFVVPVHREAGKEGNCARNPGLNQEDLRSHAQHERSLNLFRGLLKPD